MDSFSVGLSNGLCASVDWLSFTVLDKSLDYVLTFMGYSRADFTALPKGGMGYKSMLKLSGYPITVLFDGKEDMGIHVTISGTAIPEAVRSYKEVLALDTPFGKGYSIGFDSTVLSDFIKGILFIGRITRLDLAIDDLGANYYTMDSLVGELENNCCVSKFRSWRNVCERSLLGEKTGHTVYLGSRQSNTFLRVYDKRLEQMRKNDNDADSLDIGTEWVRWELELKDGRAIAAAGMLASGDELGAVCVGILSNYMRLVVLDDSNRSRCSMSSVWSDFVDGISKLSLYVAGVPKTLDDKRQWIKQQVLPTLVGVIVADGGMFDIITDNFEYALNKMSRDMVDIVLKANPDSRDLLYSQGGGYGDYIAQDSI